MKNETIAKATVTFVFRGYGILSLTEKNLSWNKKATSFITFGIINFATENNFSIPISDIERIETYTYIPGGGLCIINKDGKEYQFSFKKKKDFNVFYEYLKNKILDSNTVL